MGWARLFIPFTLLGLIFTGQVWVDYAYAGHRLSWAQATGVALADWYSWALVTPLILNLEKHVPLERNRLRRFALVHLPMSLLCTIVAILLGAVMSRSITGVARPPFTLLKVHLAFFTYWAIIGIGYSISQHHRARERDLRSSQLEAQLANARLQALRMKLHPHFLFNTLNAIAALMREDIEAADRMIAKLSELLRIALDTAEVQEVPLRRELEFLATYLEVEQIRAGDRMTVLIAPDPDTLDLLVPTLILQPLVENAVRHGVYGRPGPASVELRTRSEGGKLVIEIGDNGPGPKHLIPKGHGLEDTRARLATRHGDAASLSLSPRLEGGAMVRLVLPAEPAGSDKTHRANA